MVQPDSAPRHDPVELPAGKRRPEDSEVRIFHWPVKLGHSAYLELFYRALKPHGVVPASGFALSPRWLLKNTTRGDVVHLQWAEWLWNPNRQKPAIALSKLALMFLCAGRKGVLRMWTVHNLEAHESSSRADAVGIWLLAKLSDLIICHSTETADRIHSTYRVRGKLLVMPHGSYNGWFPPTREREEVLSELNLDPSKPVLSCVGHLRDYKGLDVAAAAAGLLGENFQLLVAGKPHAKFAIEALSKQMSQLPGAVLVERALSDQEVADLLAASDLVLLPYRKITGSGALLAAWTMRRAVVASDLPYFRELLADGTAAGYLFPLNDPAGLAAAVRDALESPPAQRESAAAALAARYDWEQVIEPVASAVKAWALKARSRS